MSIPDSLITALAGGQVVPFVGSGVSLSVQRGLFPTWPQLLGRLADRLEAEARPKPAQVVRLFTEMGELNKAADEALDLLGNADFADVMRECFKLDRPDGVDLSLVDALWRLNPRVVVTTNYENVLRWSNSAAEPILNSQRGELADLLTKPTVEKPWIWHLHGHVRDVESLILAPRQYNPLYRETDDEQQAFAAARQQLRNLISNRPLLFIGFGLQDQYVMDALAVVLEMFGGYLRPSYALLKKDAAAADIWKRHKIRVIEFADYGDPLRELVDELVAGMNATPPDSRQAAPPAIPSTYINWLQTLCARLELLGLQPQRGIRATLVSVYVPLTTTADTESRRESQRAGLEAEENIDEIGEQKSHAVLLDLLGAESLYVSGAPGSGKSTFCRWVALLSSAAETPTHPIPAPEEFHEAPQDDLCGRLPLLVPLREFCNSLPDTPGCEVLTCGELESALQRWVDGKQFDGLNGRLVGEHLRHGSALVIFDGVDEVPLTAGETSPPRRPRAMFLAGVSAAVKQWVPAGNRLLVTSRPYGLSDTDRQQLGLRHAELADLPGPLQRLLVRRWFHCLEEEPSTAEGLADEMLTHVAGRPEITPLAANPLMLTAICIIFHEGGRLPQDKYDLYKRITQTVLGSRYGDEVARVRGHLCAVAYGMHTGHGLGEDRTTPSAETTLDEVDRVIRSFRAETAGTERGYVDAVHTRDDLLTRSGILESRSHDRAAFYHLSFQEFLAGERFLDLASDELSAAFLRRAYYPEWRNTLSFVFAAVIDKSSSADRAARLLASLIEQLTAVGAATDAGQSGHLAGVVADCLEILRGRGAGLSETEERAFRDYCLAAIEQEAALGDRVKLGLALGKIGDPRVPVELRDHDNEQAWVQIPAGDYVYGDDKKPFGIEQPFHISRFPVTNAQFRVFLEEAGYENPAWWSDDGWQWRSAQDIREPDSDYWRDPKWNGPTQPVVGVSWYEADAFCRWVGGRLPTEREWEAAARGPAGLVYPWGDDWKEGICNSYEADLRVTTPVGLFPAGRSAAFDLEDMAGNVWEWCRDWYDEDRDARVLRGGSWLNVSRYCRAASRVRYLPVDRYFNGGFRVLYCLQNSP